MALAYVLDPTNQYQNRAGVNNVHGFFKVFISSTDDTATTYSNFSGALNPERIDIDNNGRAVIIADNSRPYRVEMYDKTGNLLFTQYPVWCLESGGGVSDTVSIECSDGSINVDKTSVGSAVNYDLSVNREHDDAYLQWIKTVGFDMADGYYKGRYSEGTMEVGTKGIKVLSGQLYHVTVHISATKGAMSGFYDEATIAISTLDSEDAVLSTITVDRIVDYSLGLAQQFEVSADIKAESDGEIVLGIGSALGGSYSLLDMEVHRIYSGVPYLPNGIATRDWVSENYQEKLVAGSGITIDPETNEISADVAEQVQTNWNETDTSSPAYIQNKPTIPVVDQTYNASSTNAQSGTAVSSAISSAVSEIEQVPASTTSDEGKVLTVDSSGEPVWDEAPTGVPDTTASDNGKVLGVTDSSGTLGWVSQTPAQVNSDWNSNSGVSQILNKPNLATVATSGSYNDLTNKPSIPAAQVNSDWNASSGVAQILNKPANLVQDASYVHTDNNFTTTLKDKLDGIEAGADVNVQSDWNQTNSSADDYIKNKPANLVQDASYVHTDNNFTTALKDKLDGIQTGAEANVQADWTESNTSSDSYIKNKPTLATVATSGAYSDLSGKPTINNVPAVTSSDDNKVLKASYSGGVGSYSWENESGGTVTDVQVNGSSVVSGGVASITVPTVDQTYNASSTNAQSGTAVAGAVSSAVSGINQVPSSTQSDSSKVLTVNSSGIPVWENPPTEIFYVTYGTTTFQQVKAAYDAGKVPVLKYSGVLLPMCRYDSVSSGTSYAEFRLLSITDPNTTNTVLGYRRYVVRSVDGGESIWSTDYWDAAPADWNATTGANRILNKPTIPGPMAMLSYGTSTWADFEAVYPTNRVVYCKASSNSNPATGTQSRMAFMAYINNPDIASATSVEFQYYRSVSSHSDSTQGDEVYVYTLNKSTGWSVIKRNAYTKIVAGSNMTSSYSSGTLTLNATVPTTKNLVAGSGISITEGTTDIAIQSDEVSLWSDMSWSTGGDVAPGVNTDSLSETIANFERIRVYYTRSSSTSLVSTNCAEYDAAMVVSNGGFLIYAPFIRTSDSAYYVASTFISVSGTTITESNGSQWSQSAGTLDTTKVYAHPYKIVGINRIANN